MDFETVFNKIKENSPAILTGVSVVTGVAAVGFAFVKGPELMSVIKNKKLTKTEKICGVCKAAIIPVSLLGISVGCCIASEVQNSERIAAATATAAFLSDKLTKTTKDLNLLKEKTKEIVGEEKAEEITDAVVKEKASLSQATEEDIINSGSTAITKVNAVKPTGDGNQLWYDIHHDRWFRASIASVNEAYEKLASVIRNEDAGTYDDLYHYIGIKSPNDEYDSKLGWTSKMWESLGGRIDICNSSRTTVEFPETRELAYVLMPSYQAEVVTP